MSDLKTLQDQFQRAVLAGDDDVLSELVDTSKENRRALLDVYRNGYVLRLIEFLTNDYEKLHTYLGDDQFDTVARSFIAANPSTTPNARWYGAKLPGYLRDCEQFRGTLVLSELAGLERALNNVFDAQDEPALSLADLSSIAPEDWAKLTFKPHPAISRLDHSTNAADIWRALHNDEEPPEPRELGETSQLIFSRPEGMANFRPLASAEAMMWDEAAKGVCFSVLCEMLSIFGGEDTAAATAAGYLQGWINAGMLLRTDAFN